MSIDPEILELIHSDIDGVASEQDHVRLRAAIAGDAEVRDEYRRLRGLQDLLAQVEREEPPRQLAPAVMKAIRAKRTGVLVRVSAGFRQRWPGGRSVLGYAYAVAAGVVIGVVGLHFATSVGFLGLPDVERDATGTLAPTRGVSRLDLTAVGVNGFATLRPSPSGTAIGVDLSSGAPVELVLRYDPAKEGDRVEVLVVRGGETTPAGSLKLPGRAR